MNVTNIIVNFQLEGLHCWPAARQLLPNVGYLSDPHRHVFYFTAKKRVYHDDRDIEIIMFKRQIADYLTKKYFDHTVNCCNFNSNSCEMLANELQLKFELTYCSILEDNENGAEVWQK